MIDERVRRVCVEREREERVMEVMDCDRALNGRRPEVKARMIACKRC